MNLLAIVRDHARRQGLPVPAAVASSLDGYAQQCMGLLNEFCDDLNTRKLWQSNVREARWAATPTESQGPITALAPYAYEGVVPGTAYNISKRRPMDSLSPQEWQYRKVHNFVGPFVCYRIRGNELLMNAIPADGEEFSFEYYSSAFVYYPGTTGTPSTPPTYRKYWENDLDTSTVGADLAVAYLRWAWKREKGFDYAEDFARYERMILTKSARQDGPQAVSMDGRKPRGDRPGIIVPEGSWKLP